MASNTVCSGEILQTRQRRNFQFTQTEYFRVLEMKTAELFALSCDLGACLGGASPAQRAVLRQFGIALGTAYQLYDDCLDLFGSEAPPASRWGPIWQRESSRCRCLNSGKAAAQRKSAIAGDDHELGTAFPAIRRRVVVQAQYAG